MSLPAHQQLPFFLFKKGFASFLDEGKFSDVILLHNNVKYNAHKLILSHSSAYFAQILKNQNILSNDTDGNKTTRLVMNIELNTNTGFIFVHFHDPDEVFPLVVKYMYEGSIRITDDNAISLLSVSNYLIIPDLKDKVQLYLANNISSKNATKILKKALLFENDCQDIIDKSISVMARNFSQIGADSTEENMNLNFMPLAYFQKLISHPSLSVASEFTVFKAVSNYLKAFQGSTLDSIQSVAWSLFEHVRLSYLKYPELKQAMEEPFLPKQLLCEALLHRIAIHENPQEYDANLNSIPRLQRRHGARKLFEYSSDFDQSGVLYYIGTKGGLAKWRNPTIFENGVVVTASSIEKGDPISIVGRKAHECWTMDVPSSWFCVDLGSHRSLLVTYYTLRHGGNSKQDCLRNWVLQASDDGQSWNVISRHRDEKALDYNFATHSWSVEHCAKPYRFFRVLQTGHNSSNHNFLSLSALELYGELFEQ